MTILAGIDIGGTKCAVSLAALEAGNENKNGDVYWLGKTAFPTPERPDEALAALDEELRRLLKQNGIKAERLSGIGISCGGPLDSAAGLVLSPPNLPHWDRIPVVERFAGAYGVPTGLQNDANACALAEWKWGAGQGCRNMIFLTFGTGMGAGFILDGKLYSGTNDMAGEAGHMRLARVGPLGYGKAGSFEGFCSGGGIAQLARLEAERSVRRGERPLYGPTDGDWGTVTAKSVGEAAARGDRTALRVWKRVGTELGRGLAILVDLLNPERIVIGSIYARQRERLEPFVLKTLAEEALPLALSVCEVVPAGLGEQVGDYAALSVACYAMERQAGDG